VSVPLADTTGSFDSCCSIRFHLPQGMALARVQRLSREMHPSVERGRAFFTTGARFDSHRVRDSFDDVAETYLFLFNETGETNAMRLTFNFPC
jgi:hypothetical protein